MSTLGAALGLDDNQLVHATVMVGEVIRRGLPQRAAVVLIETAIVESQIQIYANPRVPESLLIPHEAENDDNFSVGPLQQQVPLWGTAADCMDPVRSAGKFLDRLVGFDWQSMPTGDAAQTVQVSAFPDRYQLQEQRAQQIVDGVWPGALAMLIPEEDEMKPFFASAVDTDDEYLVTDSGLRRLQNDVERSVVASCLGIDSGITVRKPSAQLEILRGVLSRPNAI